MKTFIYGLSKVNAVSYDLQIDYYKINRLIEDILIKHFGEQPQDLSFHFESGILKELEDVLVKEKVFYFLNYNNFHIVFSKDSFLTRKLFERHENEVCFFLNGDQMLNTVATFEPRKQTNFVYKLYIDLMEGVI